MKSFSFRKAEKRSQDEVKMLSIMRNVLEHNKPPYEPRLKRLCRISFSQTYGEIFQGDFEKLWQKIIKNGS